MRRISVGENTRAIGDKPVTRRRGRGARSIAIPRSARVAVLRVGLVCALLVSVAPLRSSGQEMPGDERAVRIGYFGPDDPEHPVGGAIWQGAKLAIEESNAAGGYRGAPFRLVQDWDENPWSGGAAGVARMVYRERVWAVIGGIDGTSTHLAEQVVAKARLALVDPISTDRTVNSANVPWMFSSAPCDRVLMETIGGALLANRDHERFVLASATDHDSRVMAEEFLSFVQRKRSGPQRHLEFHRGSQRIPALAQQLAASEARAVVVLADASDSAALVRELRAADAELLVFGGPSLARRAFVEEARAAAEGVLLPLTLEESDLAAAFAEAFEARWNAAPDYAAFHAYDSTRLLVAAVRRAGLDRARIRAALAELSPWSGVSGTIRWDELGRNARGATLGVVRDGRVRPAPRPD